MIVTVKAHEIFIAKDELVNEKEVNISNCKFKFDDEITDDFVKIAIFTKGSKSYSQVIINNECDYPAEILDSTGDCILGVVMTLSSDDRIIKRYSPIPKRFWISSGSLRTAINSEDVTASEFEQYMQVLQEQLDKINDLQLDVVEKGDYAKSQGDYAKEQANSIIKANAEASEIINKFEGNVNEYTTAFDNNASEKLKSYNDNSVAKTNKFDDNYDNKVSQFNDNAVNKINDYNSNSEQKIAEYDKHSEELNNEIEEVKKAIPKKVSELENDSNYVKNTDYATNTTGGIIKGTGAFSFTIDSEGQPKLNILDYNTYKQYSLNNFISKGTLENVIAGKKLETADNKVTSISPNSTDEQYPSAQCTYKIKQDLETLKNEVLETGTASDSFINVQDSALAELQELSVDGVCEQETTQGIQLIDCDLESQTLNGIEIKKNANGSYTLNGTATKNTLFIWTNKPFILESGTYYIGLLEKVSNFNLFLVLSGGNFDILGEPASKKYFTKTLNETTNYTSLRSYIGTGATLRNLTVYPIISKDESKMTIGSYEKFTGGQPSPSPNYPQEIKTITDSLSVTSCNKNVFDTTKIASGTSSGISYSVDNNGIIILNGTTNGNSIEIPLNTNIGLNGTYTYIPEINDKTKINNIALKDASYSNVVLSPMPTTSNINGIVTKIVLYVSSEVVFNNVTLSIQILRGTQSTATPFEQHIQSQITANLPEGEFIGKIDDTYKDTLSVEIKDDGKYHLILNKTISKVTLDGSSNIGYQNNVFVFDIDDIKQEISESKANILTISDHYIGAKVSYRSEVPNYSIVKIIGVNYQVGINDSRYTIADDYKTWLSTHNIEVYYVLETPYTVDLGVVDMPLTYDEITNIFTDSDLLPTINAKYYRNFTKTIQNLQVNEMTLKQELININNRLSALELAKASVIDDSPSIEESEVAE